MKLGTEVGLGPGHIVLHEDLAHVKKGQSSQFSAHVRCGQTAGWIKMPLGIEVGLGPGDIVLDGDPASFPIKGGTAAHSPIFGPCIVAWYGGVPRPMPLCVRWGPTSVGR